MASSPPSSEPDALLAAGAPDPWVILSTVPRVHAHDRDLSLELAHPPHLSFLTVPTRISPRGSSSSSSSVIRHPRILTADLSASLFLAVTPATATDDGGACWFVLDAASWSSHRLPGPATPGFVRFGVIAAPDGGSGSGSGFMVVGIRCLMGHDRASLSLHCFSSRTGVWVTKDVDNPRPRRAWTTLSDVIAHDGKLWWVDTAASATKGLLCCDPFADQPSMSFVPFPSRVTAVEARAHATAYDYVQVAEGTLRWLHVLCDLDETIDDEQEAPCLNGAPLLSMYAVLGDDAGGYRLQREELPHWRGSFSFSNIWESDTFKATDMPKYEQPVVALIDPNDADLLYFFLDDYLFAFDISRDVVLGHAPHGMPDRDSLLAWKLPPALAARTSRRFGSINGGAN